MLLAEVAIDIPSKSLDDSFTYSVPKRLEDSGVSIGCAVKVTFGKRPCVGFVVGLSDGEPFDGLKDIEDVLSQSYFDEFGVECAKFLSRTYISPLSTCVRLFTPPGAVPKYRKKADGRWELAKPSVDKVDDRWIVQGPEFKEYTPKSNAIKQIAIMEALAQGEMKASELSYLCGNVSSSIKALAEKGVVKIVHKRRFRTQVTQDIKERDCRTYKAATCAPVLNESQKSAVNEISDSISKHCGEVVLVDGVTGSGKTEVYMQAISHVLEEGKSAILLVPEIALTPQTVARFRARFGDDIAVLHSKMSAGERFDQWELIRQGGARLAIGPRSALFAPMQDLGIIVIDEEHESTYKQESAPRYVARDVAEWMMERCAGTLVLGSATPSIDSLYKVGTDPKWKSAIMPERANGRPMPEIDIIDMAMEFKSGEKKMFSLRLRRAIVDELSKNHKVVLLLNQRGFAKFLLCRDCGFVPKCINCSTTLTYHMSDNTLVCHHCGHSVKAPAKCPKCKSPYLRKFGVGTERVEAELRALLNAEFAEMPRFVEPGGENSGEDEKTCADVPGIIRMDADTTKGRGAHRRLLDTFASMPRAVLLGTQMIAKGLDFDDVTLVGVINADVQLHLPDFRAEERTFDLIEQVAGRAGRADLPGRVMVQTYEADNVAIRAAASYDREMFLCSELPKRKTLGYPPFMRMANIVVWGKDEEQVRFQANAIYEVVSRLVSDEYSGSGDVEVLRAGQCVLSKVRNDYRWHIIVKSKNKWDISAFLNEAFPKIRAVKDVNIAFDVDPYDLL